MPNTRSTLSAESVRRQVGADEWSTLAIVQFCAGPQGLGLELDVEQPAGGSTRYLWVVPRGRLTGSTVDDLMLSLDLGIRKHLVTDAGQELRLRLERDGRPSDSQEVL